MKKTLYSLVLLACVAIIASCNRNNGSITMGDKSQLDSLSYALGINVGTGLNRSMGDIPFDIDAILKGVNESALGTSKMTHEAALDTLRSFFYVTRPQRAQEIALERAKLPDSLRGDLPKADPRMFENEDERRFFSYAFGVDMGNNMRQDEIPLQLIWFGEGMKDITDSENEPRMTGIEAGRRIQQYFMVDVPARNKKANEEWLASIEKKAGVKKTESGLLYKIEKKGDENLMAKSPRDVVKVHYTGWNHKGEMFDTSRFEDMPEEQQEQMKKMDPEKYAEGREFKTSLNRVIPGWTEGLQLVGKGGKITLWIPSELAYGSRGASKLIPQNEALKFDIEVLDVIPFEESELIVPNNPVQVVPAEK